MTSRDERAFLEDIVTSAKLVLAYVENLTLDEFKASIEKQDSVIRRLEIISEAGSNLSEQTRREISDVPWPKVKGMRNLIVHQYWQVDPDQVWAVIQSELPRLIAAVERHLP